MKHDAALHNRRRVWRLAKSLNALLERVEMTSSCCAGIPVKSLFESNEKIERPAWIYSTKPRKLVLAGHFAGSMPLFHRMVKMPLELVNVYISLVEFSGYTHITGLRMAKEDGGEVQIGYNIPKNEHLLTKERIRVAGFMVVADGDGISGLAIISTSGNVIHD